MEKSTWKATPHDEPERRASRFESTDRTLATAQLVGGPLHGETLRVPARIGVIDLHLGDGTYASYVLSAGGRWQYGGIKPPIAAATRNRAMAVGVVLAANGRTPGGANRIEPEPANQPYAARSAGAATDAGSSDLVGRAGLEPATNGLKVRCSTN